MEKETLPTDEELLISKFAPGEWDEYMECNLNTDITPSVVEAMQEHTRLHTAPLLERIKELEKEKKGYNNLYQNQLKRSIDLSEENERLREALDGIMHSCSCNISDPTCLAIYMEIKELFKNK